MQNGLVFPLNIVWFNFSKVLLWIQIDSKYKTLRLLIVDEVITVSRLEPLREDSLLFTTKSPETHGTHLIDLERMKDWVDPGAA